MADKITVLLVDDHALVRRGFRRLLEDDPSIVVVGEGSNGDEAIQLMKELSPHVVVMDAAMPGTNGLAAEILALADAGLRERVLAARRKQSADVLARAAGLPARLRELLNKKS